MLLKFIALYIEQEGVVIMTTMNAISTKMILIEFVKAATAEIDAAYAKFSECCKTEDLQQTKDAVDKIIKITKIDAMIVEAFAANAVDAGNNIDDVKNIKNLYYESVNNTMKSALELCDMVIATQA